MISAESFLNGFVNWEKARVLSYPLKLERTRHLFGLCGLPVVLPFKVFLIAGSKGKGSTAAMIESILRSAGLKTGLYTSPHLERWNERIRVLTRDISDREASAIASRMAAALKGARFPFGRPTYFEVMTAMALLFFQKAAIDAAVLEVGLGGEFDATNACEPDISIVTTLGFEHTDVLGKTLDRIARAKCGILREGKAAVVSPQSQDALRAVRLCAAEKKVRPVFVSETVEVRDSGVRGMRQSFRLEGPWGNEGPFDLALAGAHQLENAAAAYVAARIFFEKEGRTVSAAVFRRAFKQVAWPGRLELVRNRPRLVLDGAHSPESACALVAALQRHCHPRRVELVLGMLKDKDPEGFLRPFKGVPVRVLAVPVRNPRSFDPARIAGKARAMGFASHAVASVQKALAEAGRRAGKSGWVLVAGSLYLVGEARKFLRRQGKHAIKVER